MEAGTFFHSYFDEVRLRLGDASQEELSWLCDMLVATRDRKKKVLLAGNGGSASIAAHVAVDMLKVLGLKAMTFNEPNLITCYANDYGHEQWIREAILSYADPDDLVILISSSGRSPNILNAAKAAKDWSLPLITLSGFDTDNLLRSLGDLNLWTDSKRYNVVETVHQTWLLSCIDRTAK